MARLSVLLASILCIVSQETTAQADLTRVPPDWQTHAEKTAYRETPNYEDTMAYARRLDAASPFVRMVEFGKSGEGRSLQFLVVANGRAQSRVDARRQKKAIVLIQACIHAGETDGKDAGLALIRDIVITKVHHTLLNHAVVLFIPIYNVDGHERRSPYNRINQNGPAEMGWRGNATNLNLNRDYMKVDAPETRAWLRLWNEWQPDLFIDCHVTDGADFRYHVTYQFEQHENVSAPIRNWSREAFDRRIIPGAESETNLLSPYMVFRDNRDHMKGIDSFIATPRFATGYVPVVRNRPALLIETHMLKEHGERVRGTYEILRAALEEVNRDPAGLIAAGNEADREATSLGEYDASRSLALSVKLTETPSEKLLKGWEYRTEKSDVSGITRVVWGKKPSDFKVPFYEGARPVVSVTPPGFYIIPPQWKQVRDVLKAHGVLTKTLNSPLELEVESYRFREVKFNQSSFEGRVLVSFKTELVREKRKFSGGSIVVSLRQPASRVAIHLLEPDAPDSLVTWGFFNSVFEQKESGEQYILEKLAREMLAKDAALKSEFESRVANDSKFASSSSERLQFFYERSPYFDRQMNLYPIGRGVSRVPDAVLDNRAK